MHLHVHLEPLELALELEEQSKLEYEGKVFLALHESHEVVSLNFVIKVANAFCLVHKSNFKSVYPLLFCDVKLLILNYPPGLCLIGDRCLVILPLYEVCCGSYVLHQLLVQYLHSK